MNGLIYSILVCIYYTLFIPYFVIDYLKKQTSRRLYCLIAVEHSHTAEYIQFVEEHRKVAEEHRKAAEECNLAVEEHRKAAEEHRKAAEEDTLAAR